MKQPVLRVDRSPLNERRWCLELKCGHEVWITSKREPQRKIIKCSACEIRKRLGSAP